MSVRRTISVAAFAAMTNAVFPASAAHAQWTLTILHPEGAQTSLAHGAGGGGQQVGSSVVDSVFRASSWTGTAVSRLDLHPAGSTQSEANAISGGQQVGYARFGGPRRAGLWIGRADTWVDLSPPDATDSIARAVHNGQQGGDVRLNGGPPRASLWTGAAASRVDLHPVGMDGLEMSTVRGISGGMQGGFAVRVSGGVRSWRAILWRGSGDQWSDLTPSIASDAVVLAMDGDQQAGYVSGAGFAQRASLWSGTAESWVDLQPPGVFGSSVVYAASGGLQVGQVFFNDQYRASLWSGTAASWVDLSPFLPANYNESRAAGISSDGINTYITGWGSIPTGNSEYRYEAWLLTRSDVSIFANGFED